MAITDTLTTREAVRRAALEDLVGRAQGAATTMEGGPLDGIEVVSIGSLQEAMTAALLIALPAPSDHYAEVITPAKIVVSAVCPECRLPMPIGVTLTPQLVVDIDGAELKVKATTKPSVHVCHQLPLPDADSDQGTLFPITDLRLQILGVVRDLGTAYEERDGDETGTPVTLEAIADALGDDYRGESALQDLEDTLFEYAHPKDESEPLVAIETRKGVFAKVYVITDAGRGILEVAAAADGTYDHDSDEQPE